MDILVKKRVMGLACVIMGGGESCRQGFGGEPERKRLLGRPRHRWEGTSRQILNQSGQVAGSL